MEESDAQRALRAKLMAIQANASLTDAEKAQARQQLLCGGWAASKSTDASSEDKADKKEGAAKSGTAAKAAEKKQDLLEDTLKCVICCGLCERPVTSPCQHNFCLNCFKRWLGQGKKTCPTCRAPFPKKFSDNPRINTLLTYAIRCAKQGIKADAAKTVARIADESRPAEAFTTERAVRNGRANAASGRIMVSVPNDHFGPILPEHDPTNGKGVQVGDWWKDRLDCRQWGAHFPHVAGIAGQSNRGAQSVVLSGGYEDDHDEGEWFLYTGSGGRDLSGNKRTNKTQSFDQDFEAMNKALKISCLRGLPVRVVRSAKEKRSSYAPPPETPVRYDGIYRILRCWRKKGAQGFLMCRYLFVRCDNSPAPWTSDESGDGVRLEVPDLADKEIKAAKGAVYEMADNPYWDFNAESGQWGWSKEAPPSQKAPGGGDTVKKLKKKASAHERLLRDFGCGLCKCVLDQPLSMPCGHNFCKSCLDGRFAAAEAAAAAAKGGGSKALAEAQPARALRVRKVAKPCPSCKADLSDFLSQAAVNTEMAELIRRLQEAAEAARQAADAEEKQLADEGDKEAGQEEGAEEEEEQGGEEEEDGEEEEAAGGDDDAGCSSKAPPAKKRRVAKAKPAAAAAAAAAEEQQEEEQQEEQQQQEAEEAPAAPASPAAAAGGGGGGGRYSSELSELCRLFPEFDGGLIGSLLDDQGGDAAEVSAYLKRMRNQAKREQSKKQSAAAAAEAGADGDDAPASASKSRGKGRAKSKGTGSKKGGGKGRKLPAAEEAAAGLEEGEQEEGDGDAPVQQAEGAAGNGAAGEADGEQQRQEQPDTQPASDTDAAAAADGSDVRACEKKKAAAAGAAAAASGAADETGEDAAAAGAKEPAGKKRRAPASSGGRAKRAK